MDSRLSKPYKSCLGAGTEKRKRKKKKNLWKDKKKEYNNSKNIRLQIQEKKIKCS
jgi:hypothetical protein